VAQIRVHLAHAGHAILGDDLYGVTGGGASRASGLLVACPALPSWAGVQQAGHQADRARRDGRFLTTLLLLRFAGPWIGRHALHAAAVTIQHPRTGVPLTVRAPLPPDFLDAMAQLGLQAPAGTGSLDAAGSSAGAGIR
jgi:23S rRNA-/tRNA-specific pseudouridylate synthase